MQYSALGAHRMSTLRLNWFILLIVVARQRKKRATGWHRNNLAGMNVQSRIFETDRAIYWLLSESRFSAN